MSNQNGRVEFSTVCEKCGRTLYEGEMLNINGKYVCEPCADRCVFGEFGGEPRARKVSSPFFNFVFSFMPGAGQMYQGFMKRGLFQMCLFFFCIYLTASVMPDFFGFTIPIVWFYSFFDSISLRRKVADGEYVSDDLGSVAAFIGHYKWLIAAALIVMLLISGVTSAIGLLMYNTAPTSSNVEVRIDGAPTETVSVVQDGGGATIYVPPVVVPHVVRPFRTFSPMLLIFIGGIIVIKSGRKDKRGKHDKRGKTSKDVSDMDIYDSND